MSLSGQGKITTTVKGCARCRGTHKHITFEPFAYNGVDDVDGDYTHWAACPRTYEPILLRISLMKTVPGRTHSGS